MHSTDCCRRENRFVPSLVVRLFLAEAEWIVQSVFAAIFIMALRHANGHGVNLSDVVCHAVIHPGVYKVCGASS